MGRLRRKSSRSTSASPLLVSQGTLLVLTLLESVVQAKPGWKEGTRVKFAGMGNEREDGGPPSDVVFVIEEKAHPSFKRVGDDLETTVTIPLA